MPDPIRSRPDGVAVAIDLVASADWGTFAARRPESVRVLAACDHFTGQAGGMLLIRGASGGVERVLFGLGDKSGPGAMAIRALAASLPPGDYAIDGSLAGLEPGQIVLAWSLGAYRFDRYKQSRGDAAPSLAAPAGADVSEAHAMAHACALARDMINTPANDMGPLQIETIAREIAQANHAAITITVGDALIDAGYPAIHAVGRAAVASRAPRMIEIAWGDAYRPLIALVGKGVVFDTGGLDIKPSAGMRLMKKDMGGAAHALARPGWPQGAEIQAIRALYAVLKARFA